MPVEKLLGRPPRRPSRSSGWRAALRWRDWSIPVKLSAVTLVPIVLALVLGVTAIVGQVGRSGDYERIDKLVGLSTQLRKLTDGLQKERTLTAAQLTAGTAGVTPELKAARAATDAAVEPFITAANRVGGSESSVSGAVNSATAQVNEIAVIRQQVGAGLLDPAEAVGDYNAVTGALIGADTAVAAGASADALGGTPSALHDLEAAKEQVSVSQALVAYGISKNNLEEQQLSDVRDAELRYDDRIDDFNAASTAPQRQDLESTLKPDTAYDRKRMVGIVLGEQGGNDQGLSRVPLQEWNDASNAVVGQLSDVGNRMSDDATAASAALVEDAGSSAGLLAVLLFAAMVAAAAVVFLITRQILRSLRTLRRSALDVAEKDLPAAVRNIQEGRAQSVEVEPVPVRASDEIGEVARAFEKVHSQALRLATEQAAMRAGYSSVFVNLSRRSQSLVQRQLQLIERLERDEEDADQLATLFQLDHLATRMRRNNENLMVLSGAEPGRRSGQPVAAHDVLRAAVSEIEQYQRVSVQQPPAVKIVGFAASDVQRLIAELLDNATAFSAPETQVTVATRLADDGSLNVDILDKGIGMNEYEVVEANGRLTEAGSVDLATSRRMGLFVVGRLAGRHRIGVSLHGGKDIVGVRATVVVPPELVMTGAALENPPQAKPGPFGSVAAPPASPGGLPRRQRPVNGSARPGIDRPLVPQQPIPGVDEQQLWPSASDLAGFANGHTVDSGVRPPSDLEISGTALFSPIPRDDSTPPPAPPLPRMPQIVDVPPPRPEPEPRPEARPEPVDERQGELPSGKDLFSANGTTLSEWWNEAAQKVPEVPPPTAAETTIENTPIFDEMLSAWFRSPAPAADDKTTKPTGPDQTAEKTAEDEPAAEAGEQPATGSAEPEPGVAPVTTPEQDERNWDFASDENWRTVQAVSQVEPTAFTKSGLPRRRRGEQLMPGSATPEQLPAAESAAPGLPVRDPADVRGRLTSFQRGVNRGRQEVRDGFVEGTPNQPDQVEQGPVEQGRIEQGPVEQSPADQGQGHQGLGANALNRLDGAPTTGLTPQPATEPGGAATVDQPSGATAFVPGGPDQPAAAAEPTVPPEQDTEITAEYPGFAGALDAMDAERSALDAAQADAPERDGGTGAFGVPPRAEQNGSAGRPAVANAFGAGQAETPEQDSVARPARRDVASAFGAARTNQPVPADQPVASDEPVQSDQADQPVPPAFDPQGGWRNGSNGNGAAVRPSPTPRPAPRPEGEVPGRPAAPESLPTRRPAASNLPPGPPAVDPGHVPAAVANLEAAAAATPPTEWAFGSDEGWRTVQSVSQSTPTSFTSAGLPRRRRGEQLLPGSAPPPAGAASPRPTRDAHDVRGRLSSFQQGIQRGRHRTGQAAETNHETLEGE
ncbi:nitrate- and nitrite sensing domain-containing protein [Amycolatopsis rhabdoformis]|uniref:histidine kinase n=1 Tax=Amycolatopsis rhabdoformis TaxID=1448059 RepID=A0ABZ1IB90_9PSEU|nr:nitrate- and nitrite sensing domain-containing protein [Amycolatopsis rhabdoformis]WSE30829.1 nitrate- and nitrite sensing domain-containing protein [Amycolatopsis rhabdoformis]